LCHFTLNQRKKEDSPTGRTGSQNEQASAMIQSVIDQVPRAVGGLAR
jgi:hypothetical protein